MKVFKYLIAAAIIGGGVYYSSISTQVNAQTNPKCPNGCVWGNAEGCYCYQQYDQYDEYDWGFQP